jgi:hypothetical protein
MDWGWRRHLNRIGAGEEGFGLEVRADGEEGGAVAEHGGCVGGARRWQSRAMVYCRAVVWSRLWFRICGGDGGKKLR